MGASLASITQTRVWWFMSTWNWKI
jgi:hypothetical protein